MAKRFWSFTKGYRFLTLICPVMVFLDVIIELKIPEAMGRVVDILYQLGAEGVDPDKIKKEILIKLLEMLGLCALTLVIGYIGSRCSAISSMGFGANLRRALFGQIQDLSFENIDKLEKTEAKRRTLISFDELFPWPLAAAGLFLLLGILLNFARRRSAP